MNKSKLRELKPGREISTTVRILKEPQHSSFKGKEIVKAKIGDDSSIANLVAWDKQTCRWVFRMGDLIEIERGECPRSHKDAYSPPTINISAHTVVRKKEKQGGFPSIQECMSKRFLAEIPDYSYGVVRGFITQVYKTASYYCVDCKKFTDEMCDCGNFPDPLFRITGVFADGTDTVPLTIISEEAAETLTGEKRGDAKKIDPKIVMDRPHTFLGYRRERFYVEEVME